MKYLKKQKIKKGFEFLREYKDNHFYERTESGYTETCSHKKEDKYD